MNSVYRIELGDRRVFKVNCVNQNQFNRMMLACEKLRKTHVVHVNGMVNGIHTVKQWEEITETL